MYKRGKTFMRKFLTAPQIAKYEEVTSETVTRWIRNGVFPGTRRVGRSYKIPIDSYNKWREGTHLPVAKTSNNSVRTTVRTDA